MIRITDHPNMSSAVCCECYRKNQTNKAIFGEKKCILMLILLEINAFIKKSNFPTLPGWEYFVFTEIFCWHGHFSYLLDSRRADIC